MDDADGGQPLAESPADADHDLAEVLAAAFADYPAFEYMCGENPDAARPFLQWFFRAYLPAVRAVPGGHVLCGSPSVTCVSIILPPGPTEESVPGGHTAPRLLSLLWHGFWQMPLRFGVGYLRRALEVMGELEAGEAFLRRQLGGPWWFQDFLCVSPHAQGGGLGRAALEHGVATVMTPLPGAASSTLLPVVLNTYSPRARKFYHRHGFIEVGSQKAGRWVHWFVRLRDSTTRLGPIDLPPTWRIGLIPTTDTCARFVLAVRPVVSAEDVLGGRAFGPYFAEEEQDRGRTPSLRDLDQSTDSFETAVGHLAWRWLVARGKWVLDEIINEECGVYPAAGYVDFERVTVSRNHVHFHFRETVPGCCDATILETMLSEVREGGDTWDCGDFGDITPSIAANSGFADAWKSRLSTTSVDPARVRVRVTLCDHNAHYVDVDV